MNAKNCGLWIRRVNLVSLVSRALHMFSELPIFFFIILASRKAHGCKHTHVYMKTCIHKAHVLTCEHMHTPTQHTLHRLHPHLHMFICLYAHGHTPIYTNAHMFVYVCSHISLEYLVFKKKRKAQTHTPDFDTHKF